MLVTIGNMFDSHAKTLVNTVNCVGVMGKGIAQEFKRRYPAMFEEYEQLCNRNEVHPGVPYVYSDLLGTSIINFPTKDHWRSPSKISYIKSGLDWFRENYQKYGISSVAFPPLGCGNGGLPWTVVGPLMYEKLNDLPISIEIYAPYGTPQEQLTREYLEENIFHTTGEIIGQNRIKLDPYWLFIPYVVTKLNHNRYALNVGRTIRQKVCYLLERSGIPMGFRFKEGSYGPYSKEVDQAVMALSNANIITERRLGRMVETVVSPSFKFPESRFSPQDIANADKAVDLLSRIKNTEQAEMVATVLFAYDELDENNEKPSDYDVLQHILGWKARWKGEKEQEIIATIFHLSASGWMTPIHSEKLASPEDELY